MGIREAMTLDHFYVALPSARFDEMRALANGLAGSPYQGVKSGKDVWRGIYPGSNIGSYFEIIEEAPWITRTEAVRLTHYSLRATKTQILIRAI